MKAVQGRARTCKDVGACGSMWEHVGACGSMWEHVGGGVEMGGFAGRSVDCGNDRMSVLIATRVIEEVWNIVRW